MNPALIAIAVIIILSGALGSRVFVAKSTPLPSESSEPTQTEAPVPTQTEAPSSGVSSDYAGWVYPNASIVSEGDILVLSSSDNPDTITDWYRNKIESGGYNVRNSIKTSANDVVKNVIQAVAGKTSVNVEITKNPSDQKVRIEVELSF